MRKCNRNLKIWALILLLGISSPAAYAQAVFLNPFTDIIHQFSTPKDLVKYMKKNFEFKKDARLFGRMDYWQSPEEFLKRKSGDCEDYALFSQHILKQQGIEALVVSFYGPNIAHTVTVYKENERYNVINEDRLYTYQTKTIEEALSRIHPTWTWGAIAEKKGAHGSMVKKLTNENYSVKRKRFFLLRLFGLK